METKRIDAKWRLPDAMWQRIQPLLPKYPISKRGGRSRADFRAVVDGIFYRLRTGCQWKALPPEFSSGSTVHHYFQEWVRQGVFQAIWRVSLEEYDELRGIAWQWQAMDGAMTKAPLGGGATGKNPTDRAKCGTKRSVLTDRRGVPLGIIVAGANRPDMKFVEDTINSMPVPRPEPTATEPQNMCMDKGYDYPEIRTLVEEYGYTAHIPMKGEDVTKRKRTPGYRARRWVVERTHSWMNRFRSLLIRWEKSTENYEGLLHLACAWITFSLAGVFG
jgi:putative transposase